ncbi:zinc-binding dehydrogenase [candidate division KSB1 bacterium]
MAEMGTRLVFTAANQATMEKFDIPDPGEGQLLIETECSLISLGTELFWYTGEHTFFKDGTWTYPFHSGYSNVARIKAVGSEVKGYQVGDRVFTLSPHTSHHLVDSDSADIYPVPEGVDSESAAFTALGWVALHGAKTANLSLGESVLIIGQGLVGQLALRVARLSGAGPIVVVDSRLKRLEWSAEGGPDAAFPADDPELDAKVKETVGNDGAEVVLDTTGNPAALKSALRLAAPRGRVVVLGSPHGTVELDLYRDIHRRQLRILGAYQPAAPEEATPYYHWSRGRICRLMLELIDKGDLDPKIFITRRRPSEEAPKIFADLARERSNDLGVVLKW